MLKDDYTLVFGKHMLKAGGLASMNKKNEDVLGYGSSESALFWGSGGLPGWGANSGNILADFLIKDMTWGFSENSGQRQVRKQSSQGRPHARVLRLLPRLNPVRRPRRRASKARRESFRPA